MLVLHVGPHKTGTTYLQANFKQQRSDLLKRGWLYPALGVRTGLAHHEIVEHADQIVSGSGRVFDDVAAVAREARAKQLNVLLSAEGFRRWRPRKIEALARMFGERQLRIVYVLRDPIAVVRSMWAQSVKLGGTDPLPRFLARHVRDPARSRLLNPLRDLKPHLRRDVADFTILLYDEIVGRGLDLYSAFASEALELNDIAPTAASANARQPLEATEFLRLLSTVGGYVSRPGRLDVGDAVRLLFSPEEREEIVATIRERGAGARRRVAVSRHTAHYAKLQAELLELVGPHLRPRPEGERLFPSDPETWDYYEADALMRVPEVARLVGRASRSMGRTGVRLAVMNGGLQAVMAGRRLRNLVAARLP
ncbi:hypothetical protein IHQ68_19375 [Chelatococcus sambhunathii]|uniref:Sulfotransferase family n=1 Tax=Chelatococcus sambhunathii TaxID=363953 RepID=A0ABU1DLB2_9HYPH|nr:hypothetical protein [Chelatococcus sambhunathii]MDR4308788.1 hypothetical protein [Chelatococcus sambhunathii]